jgi:UDP-hydrolysing UDP-N-acetyl-D-glucosamine 2-epimerase
VRRIAVVTGTRAEYGLLKSTMQAIAADPRLKLQVVVTGMHLLRKFGHTVDEIVRDGWRIDARVAMQSGSDAPLDQATGLARGVAGLARFFRAARTDIVVVLGDRIEALAGALAAVTTGRLVAHIHGGDVASGDFDDALRHAITKLAHVHLAATRDAARRIVRMGEDPRSVHVVGAPGLDRLRELVAERRRPRASGAAGQALVIYHAWGRPAAVEARTMDALLRAVAERGLRRLILYPNSDRGHRGVLQALARHARRHARDVEVVRSLPRDAYLRALLAADVLVGNSSSGIIEAPLAGTPSVNVGQRQAGRQVGGRSVVQVGEPYAAVRAGLAAALRLRTHAGGRTVYGDGRAGARIARILARVPIGPGAARKLICY